MRYLLCHARRVFIVDLIYPVYSVCIRSVGISNPGFEVTLSLSLHFVDCFQIASIVLWTLDDYQLYAGTIAIISIISIVTTLVETRAVSCSLPLSLGSQIEIDLLIEHETHDRNVKVCLRCECIQGRPV